MLTRSGLSKCQTQLLYSYILMWVLPEMVREENIVRGNLVQKCLPNQLVGRYELYNLYTIIFLYCKISEFRFYNRIIL